MASWHIVVEAEDGRREPVGRVSADLVALTGRAIALADELGKMACGHPRDCQVDLVAADGRVELSIAVVTGGLDPREASSES